MNKELKKAIHDDNLNDFIKYNEKRKMTKQPAATLRCQKYKHNFARNKKRNQLYHQF